MRWLIRYWRSSMTLASGYSSMSRWKREVWRSFSARTTGELFVVADEDEPVRTVDRGVGARLREL